MFTRKISVLTLICMLTASAAFAAPAAMLADDQAVNAACAADAATAGCGNQQVGKGLLKCMRAYKQSHAGFDYSAGCKAAVQKRHADKTAK